jgi:hypothetical protein
MQDGGVCFWNLKTTKSSFVEVSGTKKQCQIFYDLSLSSARHLITAHLFDTMCTIYSTCACVAVERIICVEKF